ncbi:MAG: XRE family transcriptional regulator [Oscillospiraceae bacterium]|nr:XRE family transcriptional regulator [Oscillospiraceae bacterium]
MKKNGKGSILPLQVSGSVSYDAEAERQQNIIGLRLQEARRRTGMSLVTFSEYLKGFGLSIGSRGLSKWENGDNVPGAYQLIAISNALCLEDGIRYFMSSYDAPLNEAGLQKVSDYRADLIASGRYRPRPKRSGSIQTCLMPVCLMKASAGPGNFLDDDNFERKEFPTDAVPVDADFGIQVSGDSMEPVYQDGQTVWVQRCSSLQIGEVGIFVCDGEGFLKRYSEQEPSEDDAEAFTDSEGLVHPQPVLISYNPAYAPRVVAPSVPFQIVGRVLR